MIKVRQKINNLITFKYLNLYYYIKTSICQIIKKKTGLEVEEVKLVSVVQNHDSLTRRRTQVQMMLLVSRKELKLGKVMPMLKQMVMVVQCSMLPRR